ncbi:MAG: hypothetical protein ACFFG0_13805 [Candidatus Thorarchaeota archaeon]
MINQNGHSFGNVYSNKKILFYVLGFSLMKLYKNVEGSSCFVRIPDEK